MKRISEKHLATIFFFLSTYPSSQEQKERKRGRERNWKNIFKLLGKIPKGYGVEKLVFCVLCFSATSREFNHAKNFVKKKKEKEKSIR